MSACDSGCAKIAAELARLRGNSMPSVAELKRRIASTIPCGPSAVAKWVMSVIDFAAPVLCNRSSALRATGTVKPRRFMPVLILKKISSGLAGREASSMRNCSSLCTTAARSDAAITGSSLASKNPSNSKIGCAEPASRIAIALSSSTMAKPSAFTSARATRSTPCPYPFAFTTANTFDCSAARFATA